MATEAKAKMGSVEDLLKRYSPEVQKWAKALRKMMRATAPGASERVYLGWRVIMFCRGGEGMKKMKNMKNMKNMFCAIGPLKNGVNLYFGQGAILPDPHKLLEGTGKGMRHVKIRSTADLRKPGIKQLVRAAYRLTRN